MRAKLIILCVAGASLGAPSLAADQPAPPSWTSHEEEAVPRRRGYPVAEFSVDGRQVVVNAYGRRMRARALDNMDALRRARVEHKVLDGAPAPALLTLEVSINF